MSRGQLHDVRRALVAGWFSFERRGATAGDLMARDVAAGWLAEAGLPCDLALAAPFAGGVDWESVDPGRYSHLIFVCGPFHARRKAVELLPRPARAALLLVNPLLKGPMSRFRLSELELLVNRFPHARLIGLDVSMLGPPETWHPFDALVERDGRGRGRPDLAFASEQAHVPVIGLSFVEPRPAGQEGLHEAAERVIGEALSTRPMAQVRIDTRLDVANQVGLRSPAEVESLIARMDAMITTRLHGGVLALKNGVPAVMVDALPGGSKVRAQAETLGWKVVLGADGFSTRAVGEALDFCLTDEARVLAGECQARALTLLGQVRKEFLAVIDHSDGRATS